MVSRHTHPNLPDAPPLGGGASAVYELHLELEGTRGNRFVVEAGGS